jgi:hypothetical protein
MIPGDAPGANSGIPVRDGKWLKSVKTDIYIREAIFLAQEIKNGGKMVDR